jgi:hypothetical protein
MTTLLQPTMKLITAFGATIVPNAPNTMAQKTPATVSHVSTVTSQ